MRLQDLHCRCDSESDPLHDETMLCNLHPCHIRPGVHELCQPANDLDSDIACKDKGFFLENQHIFGHA